MALRPHPKTHATVSFKGLSLELTPDFISRITRLPLGLPWSKEEKALGQVAKKTFFQPGEDPVEDKNGVRRTSLPPPWNEVSYQIMKYINFEGRFNIIYGYHFRLLHELRYGMDLPPVRKPSLPYFLLQSLIECSTKLNVGVPDQLAHHGLIKLLLEDALHTYTIPIAWEIFKNMSSEDNIKTLTGDINPSGSEEEGEKREIEEEMHETQHIQIEEEQETEEKQKGKEKYDKTTIEPKAENKLTSKSEKRKRTKVEKKKAKKGKKNTATGKVGTQQEKE